MRTVLALAAIAALVAAAKKEETNKKHIGMLDDLGEGVVRAADGIGGKEAVTVCLQARREMRPIVEAVRTDDIAQGGLRGAEELVRSGSEAARKASVKAEAKKVKSGLESFLEQGQKTLSGFFKAEKKRGGNKGKGGKHRGR
ncbi:MAG: hypothetical protein RLN62_03165 [Rickettsiales bacterium]